MSSVLVPVELVVGEDGISIAPGVSAFVETTPIPEGWKVELILANREAGRQVNLEFRSQRETSTPSLKTALAVNPGCPILILAGTEDDMVAILLCGDFSFQASTSFTRLEKIINYSFDEEAGNGVEFDDETDNTDHVRHPH